MYDALSPPIVDNRDEPLTDAELLAALEMALEHDKFHALLREDILHPTYPTRASIYVDNIALDYRNFSGE